ncbi:MAG: aminotransferase class IV [Verrucomicrobiota bacterium]
MAAHGTHNALDDPRNESVLISINGELIPRPDAKISVFDSGFLVGDGVWEGMRVYGGKLAFADEHFSRLEEAAKAISLDIGLTRNELATRIDEVLKANNMTDGVHVRLMVTRGNKKTPSQDPRLALWGPNIVIIAEHKSVDPTTYERGITLFTSTVRRGSPDYLDPRFNCHSKLHEVIALNQALAAGADEALMLDLHGFVSTCNATNFFIVKNGDELWTSTGKYCMNGITRGKVLEVARAHGMTTLEKDFSLYDTYSADEAFVTGTFGGLTPVTAIDGNPVGSGAPPRPVTDQLRNWYEDAVQASVSP